MMLIHFCLGQFSNPQGKLREEQNKLGSIFRIWYMICFAKFYA